jgi:peptidoglycan hydrolase CwlO-like protein
MKLVYIAAVVVVIIIVARYYKNEEFSSTNAQIIENYPTPPQNVLVTDVNGNFSVSNDLGLQHLTVAGNAQLENLSVKNRNILNVLDELKAKIDAANARLNSVNATTNAAAAAITLTDKQLKGLFCQMWDGINGCLYK